jgi:ribokinase
MSGCVLVVGSINVDLVVSLARLPVPGETVTGGSFASHPGGKGGNQAVAAARMGARVSFIGAVGDDELGEAALADLSAEGVDVSRIARLPDISTGVALIVVDERGQNQIAVASGANAGVDGRLVESATRSIDMPVGSAYLANLEVGDDAVLAGARFAVAHGLHVVINPAPARQLTAELLDLAPVLVPNQQEAESLTGEAQPDAAALALAARSGAPVIVTLGAAGALLVGPDGVEHLPAPSVQVVDTTGAGDTFAGVFAAQLASGAALLEAARFAVRAASMSVTVPGARGGMPTRAQLETLPD